MTNRNFTSYRDFNGLSLDSLSTDYLMPVKGTNYRKASTSRHIFSETLRLYYGNRLFAGNSKLQKNILIFDLLPIITCPNCSKCKSTCYAVAANRYKGAFNSRLINTLLASTAQGRNELYNVISRQLSRTSKKLVRLHSSGDIFAQAYADLLTAICLDFPHIQFYGYTKTAYQIKAANCNLVQSILPNGGLNYGSNEYVQRMAEKYHATVCDYATENPKMHCGINCYACMSQPFVLFHLHGTAASNAVKTA